MLAPGTRVAHRSAHAPTMVALGIVSADGGHVVWLALVEVGDDGCARRRDTAARVCRTPLPLRGDEVPCPAEFLHFYDGVTKSGAA